MSDIALANTSTQLSGKTVPTCEGDYTITGQHTFDRDPSAPFVVTASSAKVSNLDADKLDGLDGAAYATLTGSETLTNKAITSPTISAPTVTGTLAGAAATFSTTLGVTGVGTFTAQSIHNAGVDLSGASAGQIVFPATQNASTNANTLDDYKEAPFTPTMIGQTSGAATYTVQVGLSTKIGGHVFFSIYLTTATNGTLVGNIQIGGLPFLSKNTANAYGGVTISYFTGLGSSVAMLGAYLAPNTQVIQMWKLAAGGAAAVTALLPADIGATELILSGHYRASA